MYEKVEVLTECVKMKQGNYKSIEAGYLLPPKDFIKFVIKESGKIMSFSRTKFTLREIIRIFDVVY